MLPLLNHLQGREVHLTPLSSNSNLRNYCLNTDMKSFLRWDWGFLLRSILYQAAIDSSAMAKIFLASRLCLILISSSGHFQCVGPICESDASATCDSHQDCSFNCRNIVSVWIAEDELVLQVLYWWLVGIIQSTNHLLIHFTFRIFHRITISCYIFHYYLLSSECLYPAPLQNSYVKT